MSEEADTANAPITIRIRDQVRKGLGRFPPNEDEDDRMHVFSPTLHSNLTRTIRPEKKLFSRSRKRRVCKRSLIRTLSARPFKSAVSVFCSTVKRFHRILHRKCSNWMIKIKLIACWNRCVVVFVPSLWCSWVCSSPVRFETRKRARCEVLRIDAIPTMSSRTRFAPSILYIPRNHSRTIVQPTFFFRLEAATSKYRGSWFRVVHSLSVGCWNGCIVCTPRRTFLD